MEPIVLIVDDEAPVRDVLRFALRKAGYQTQEAADGVEALASIAQTRPAIAVVDITMPRLSGIELCRRLRQGGDQLPLIFLSSLDDEVERIVGLELGADDYVTKPFSPREVVSRVGVVLRRARAASEPLAGTSATAAATAATQQAASAPAERPEPAGQLLRHGALVLDIGRHEASYRDQTIVLTAVEFGLLAALLRRPGFVLDRDALIDQMYRTPTVVLDRTVDSHVRKLRARLRAPGDEVIETVHGVGYRIGACLG